MLKHLDKPKNYFNMKAKSNFESNNFEISLRFK